VFELIAGPCSAETKAQILSIAQELDSIKQVKWYRAGIWKPRTRPNLFEGVGTRGLKWLAQVKQTTSLKVITEVGTPFHIEKCLEYSVDGMWIGARTTTNPFYVQELAQALRGVDIPIFIKNPLNPDIKLWIGAIERMLGQGNSQIYAIHRGFSFADNGIFRQTPYWKMPIELRRIFPNIPIICDPSHIAGKGSLIKDISQTALNIGLNGLMIEVHNNPEDALTDNSQQITPLELKQILSELRIPQNHLETISPINTLRAEMDSLDYELLDILKQRMILSIEVAKIKKEQSIPILQIERFEQMLQNRLNYSQKSDLGKDFIKEIFELIHQESIRIQDKTFKD
jgi:chorismate mutase